MKWQPDKKQVRWGATVFLTGVALMIAYVLFFRRASIAGWVVDLLGMLRSIIVGIVIAYILSPILNFVERTFFYPYYRRKGIDIFLDGNTKRRKRMRGWSVAITLVFAVLVLYGLIMILVPQLIRSITEIAYNFPGYANNFNSFINTLLADNPTLRSVADQVVDTSSQSAISFIREQLVPNLSKLVSIVRKSITQVIGFFINLLVGTIVAIYILNAKELFTGQAKKLAYAFLSDEAANEVIAGFRFIHRTFTGFIFGKLVDSAIIGVICYVATRLFQVPYPVLISVAVGITNIIPFFGPYIGAIIGVLLLVMIDPIKALVFLVIVIVLQQFDGNILGPMILGNSTGLSSFWVIFSIMLFGGFWGPIGWILGVPIFACIYAFVAYLTRNRLKQKNLPEDSRAYVNAAYIEDGTLKQMDQVDRSLDKYNVMQPASAWRRIFKSYKKSRQMIQKVNPLVHEKPPDAESAVPPSEDSAAVPDVNREG